MYQQKGDSAKGGGQILGRYTRCSVQPPKLFLPVGWGSRPWEMGFRPRTEITSLFASLMGRLTASLSGRLTAFLPQISKPAGPVIATGVLSVARFVPHGNWMTHLLANSPVGGCWARRPCHSLVGPPGATWVTPAKWWSREAPLVTRLRPWTQSMAVSLASALLMSL